MKIGILIAANERTADPATLARTLEQLGFESIWLPDHPILPVHTSTPLPETPPGQGQIPEVYSHISDPFVGMAMAAGATSRLKVATGVCLVPERNPLLTANELASLDHFSDGRLLFGIGAGWLREESEILGADFSHRWPRPENILLRCVSFGPKTRLRSMAGMLSSALFGSILSPYRTEGHRF
jgi:alkanesulfonate monooxygenase SsuD/methylene tetrahydromethanopterin reductase-like flavin-dependent oxidoreductase (luciferase family)